MSIIESAQIEPKTEHPHIVMRPGARQPVATIAGTGLDVWAIVGHYRSGLSPDEIAQKWALSLAQVYDALSYYYDHPQEIDAILERRDIGEAEAQSLQERVSALLARRSGLSSSEVSARVKALQQLLFPE